MILDDSRERWWSSDHADLLAARMRLGELHSLVDIGSGRGHWTRLWEPRLAAGAKILGVERDAAHARAASAWFAAERPTANVEFTIGDALALPLADAAVDAATCQTVLMHLDAPARAVAEMVRVVRPGGLVFCAEPQNVLNLMRWSDATLDRDPAELAAVFELWLRVQRGKRASGLGDVTLGDRLVGLFEDAGLEDIAIWQTEHAFVIRPPYAPEDLRVFAADARARKRGIGAWDEARLRAHYLAGGGEDTAFTSTFAVMRRFADEDEQRVADNRYSSTHGASLFLVAGRKR